MEHLGISVGCKGTVLYVLLTILFINGKISARDAKLNNMSEDGIQILNYICMAIVLINVGGYISLTLGTVQKRHDLILFWLISSPFGMLLLTIGMISGDAYKYLIILPFYVYLWIAMFLLYKRIKSERQTGFSHLAV
ncbi:uncharacterized protein LOC120771223 isoform X2 [Bactrocera tryoni]|uniref:uncharacterized protein LOC120771223 isoform X2 n=1 Tax=Bactrocera tryoni TaxID=59916 RepID=UPI001A971D9E|nr:uncharacterized protein LOC120771223 isoform X2 [Bactrocera tryoni]